MHIIIGLLGSLVTIFYLLDRLGIDIGGLNPFYWYRRRAFSKKLTADPIYSIEDPLHVASLLVIGVAKLDGDLTAEQKRVAQKEFETSFSMSPKAATELFGSAAHLLAAPQLIDTQLQKLAHKNRDRFSREQAGSMLEMMGRVAAAEGQPSAAQQQFMQTVRSTLAVDQEPEGTWT
ncbi:MAG: hypothetical protein EX272_15030 [Chromatiales bacterium]|nr:MAG: hypothetical protein EX272_15030 [Chromatiales bacterium]